MEFIKCPWCGVEVPETGLDAHIDENDCITKAEKEIFKELRTPVRMTSGNFFTIVYETDKRGLIKIILDKLWNRPFTKVAWVYVPPGEEKKRKSKVKWLMDNGYQVKWMKHKDEIKLYKAVLHDKAMEKRSAIDKKRRKLDSIKAKQGCKIRRESEGREPDYTPESLTSEEIAIPGAQDLTPPNDNILDGIQKRILFKLIERCEDCPNMQEFHGSFGSLAFCYCDVIIPPDEADWYKLNMNISRLEKIDKNCPLAVIYYKPREPAAVSVVKEG